MAVLNAQNRLLTHLNVGAPALQYSAGQLIAFLDAVLVNGYGSVTLTSLVVASNIVTATVSGGHGFQIYGGGDAEFGPVIRIAGASPAGLNGDWRLSSVPDPNTFTFEVEGISDQTATGTVTAKMAPLGWTKEFSGTNLAAYRQGGGNMMYFRVDDTATYDAKVRGYEAMTGVSAGTGEFPTTSLRSTGYYMSKRGSSSGTSQWFVAGNDRLAYFGIAANASYMFYQMCVWGDLKGLTGEIDPYGTLISGSGSAYSSYSYVNHPWYRNNSTAYMAVARAASGIGGSYEINGGALSYGYSVGVSGGLTGFDYPEPNSGGLFLSSPSVALAYGSNGNIRGEFPGAVWVNNNVERYDIGGDDTFSFFRTPTGPGPLADKTLLGFYILNGNSGSPGYGFLDLLTPWHN